MINKLRSSYIKLSQYKKSLKSKTQLDSLFFLLKPEMTSEESALWLVKLALWLRDNDSAAAQWPVRSRFLFQVLDRNPDWNEGLKRILKKVFSELQIVDLICESGLSLEQGLWSEMWDRIFTAILPQKPLIQDTSLLLNEVFPPGTDLEIFDSLDLAPWIDLLKSVGVDHLFDVEEGFIFLLSQTRAIAFHPSLRKKMETLTLRELPWHFLTTEGEAFLKSKNANQFEILLKDCNLSLGKIYSHLQDYGVSTDLVFKLEMLQVLLKRIQLLIPVVQNRSESSIRNLMVHLIDFNQQKRGVVSLFRKSSQLISQKIVEKNSETGDHYIARTASERIKLFSSAAGGGFVTAFTVYGKLWILTLAVSPFFLGFFSSINFSLSFILIQLLGFSLATKQPANTATTLAMQLKELHKPEKVKALVEEVFLLLSSQILAVAGNLLLVIPFSLGLTYLYWFFSGRHILSLQEATYNFEAVKFGIPTLVFAAWTGVLLWFSSLMGGWADNWCAYREIPLRLEQNSTLRTALSPQAATRVSNWVKKHLPALASNIFLGFALGLSPKIMGFFGFPLDVRHVTLSTGSLAASLPVLGFDILNSWGLVWVIAGIFCIGLMNLGISFWLAFSVALRSQKISLTQRKRIRKALFERIFRR